MGTDAQPKLLEVQLTATNSTPESSSWQDTSDAIRRVLETHGCVVVSCKEAGPEQRLQKALFGMWEELFGLPEETKAKHTSQVPGFGYGGNYASMPLFEYFGIEDGGRLEAVEDFTRLMWPLGNEKFCEALHSYTQLLSELHRMVMKMVTSSYGLEKHCDPLISASFYMTRLMRYKSPGENKSGIGILPHRDKNFLSIINTNDVGGLQIETPDGVWLDFEPSPNKFIVIVGEALMAWSNGRLYSPLHRVIARGTKEKYSIGLFSFIRGILQVPDELVDDGNPLKFKPFSNLEFLSTVGTVVRRCRVPSVIIVEFE